ncbi:hypothetical protein SCHPADRAFT_945892 [Schizopora paradoxa]|uniref:Mitochondrial intermembrane space import and assembly protein 40 n=1 Tax=Schizopora paradoxa TaxID=27342 RepID=A0A0H2R5Q3_9AGAM|nr:hypothetical protein SCHPADRAFT_945892 [Schizopora paradoxa]
MAAAGTSYMTWRTTTGNQHVMLDAQEAPKKRKPKSPPQEPEASSSKSTSEFLQELEEEAIDESNAANSSSPETPEQTPTEGEEGEISANSAAFNPETGEINWDCPCLGGMAHGPCGMEFREAFSCFVYSEEEPKGINCVEKFKAMQDCFRAHPETYGEELTNDDDDDDEDMRELDATSPVVEGNTESPSTTPPSSAQ